MAIEIEATFIEIPHTQMRQRLQKIGAVCRSPEYLMRTRIYDYADLRLDKNASWVRVRQEYDGVTLAYKQRASLAVDGVIEHQVKVDDFAVTCRFLEAIGLVPKAGQEIKREVWSYQTCEIVLNTWPWLPPVTEIEGPDEEAVNACITALGLSRTEAIYDTADGLYQRYYDVTRTEVSTIDLRFAQQPSLLVERRRVEAAI